MLPREPSSEPDDDEVGGVLDSGTAVGGGVSAAARIRAAARARAHAAAHRDDDATPALAGLDDDSDDGELADRPRRPVRQAAANAPSYRLKLSLTQPADARTAARRGVPAPLTRPPPPSHVPTIAALLRERRHRRRIGTDAQGRAAVADMAAAPADALTLAGTDAAVAELLARDAAHATRAPRWRYWVRAPRAAHHALPLPPAALRHMCPDPGLVAALLDVALDGDEAAGDALVCWMREAECADALWRAIPGALLRLGANPRYVRAGADEIDDDVCAPPDVRAIWRVAAAAAASTELPRRSAPSVVYALAILAGEGACLAAVSTLEWAAHALDEAGERAVAASLSGALGADHCAAVLGALRGALRRRVALAKLGADASPDALVAPLMRALAAGDFGGVRAHAALIDYTGRGSAALAARLADAYAHLRDGRGMDLDASRAKERVQRVQLRMRYQAGPDTAQDIF